MYDIFEHTADLGLRIRSDDLDGLFEEAACALFSVMVANLDSVRPREQLTFAVQGGHRDELLHDWLGELLYVFHADRVLLSQFDVKVEHAGLTATARGEQIDLAQHEIDAEVKAVTYHGLKVEREAGGWLAEVILDV